MTRFSAVKFSSLNILSAVLLFFFLLSINTTAQTRKTSTASKNKSQVLTKTSDQNKTAAQKNSAAKENAAKNGKQSQADSKYKTEDKKQGKIRQAEEEKRQAIEEARREEIESERRQAALEEKRRREQSVAEARARQAAFERALRTETVENISQDNTEGEDLEVRRAAVNALGNRAGTVVVLEPQTGKILTVVNQDWAIHKSFKPCSTIKLVTAVAGLNEHLIDEDGNIRFRHFPMELNDALAFSNNIYFQTVGSGLGNSKMISYAQTLGLGQPTGINVAGETAGKLPFGNSNARIYSHGDDFEVSPLQLAVLTSAISNHGKVIVPHVPRSEFEKTSFRGTIRRQISLPETSLEGVLPGMVGAATYGTARHGVDSSMGVAGKTGSCIADGSWVGLFTSVAPVSNPQYAVVVITRGQGERGKYAAVVAGKIYQTLRPRIKQNGFVNSVAKAAETKPQPQVNAKVSAQIDEIAGEESEEGDAAPVKKNTVNKTDASGKTEIIVGQTTPKIVAESKTVEKNNITSGDKSAVLFPTVVINVKKAPGESKRPRVVTNK